MLVGETGSGKSTQVVQYLYEAGMAFQKELIVRIQPRKVAAISLAKHVSLEMQVELGLCALSRPSLSNQHCDIVVANSLNNFGTSCINGKRF